MTSWNYSSVNSVSSSFQQVKPTWLLLLFHFTFSAKPRHHLLATDTKNSSHLIGRLCIHVRRNRIERSISPILSSIFISFQSDSALTWILKQVRSNSLQYGFLIVWRKNRREKPRASLRPPQSDTGHCTFQWTSQGFHRQISNRSGMPHLGPPGGWVGAADLTTDNKIVIFKITWILPIFRDTGWFKSFGIASHRTEQKTLWLLVE